MNILLSVGKVSSQFLGIEIFGLVVSAYFAVAHLPDPLKLKQDLSSLQSEF